MHDPRINSEIDNLPVRLFVVSRHPVVIKSANAIPPQFFEVPAK